MTRSPLSDPFSSSIVPYRDLVVARTSCVVGILLFVLNCVCSQIYLALKTAIGFIFPFLIKVVWSN